MKSKKIGVLLVNLGTPDSPKTSDVRKYLNEFLTDGRVIDYPWLPRQVLVKGLITPLRAKNSAKTYKEIWSDTTGSPLMYHSLQLKEKLQQAFDNNPHRAGEVHNEYEVFLAMRYQSLGLADVLQEMKMKQFDKIIVFPLFPQYASATTGSVHQLVMKNMADWWEIPDVSFINSYYDNPEMIAAYADAGAKYGLENYDHILFSFHGLPIRQLKKASKDNGCNHCQSVANCCETIGEKNKFCYGSQSYATAYAIADRLGLSKDQYTICFQSRLGRDPWMQPYASEVVEDLAKRGIKKILCFCPAFVADCLETIYEVAEEYQEEFEEYGGEKIQLVESLNDRQVWVDCIKNIIMLQ